MSTSLLAIFIFISLISKSNLSIAGKSIILLDNDSDHSSSQKDATPIVELIEHHKIYENDENDANSFFEDEHKSNLSPMKMIMENHEPSSSSDCPFGTENKKQSHDDEEHSMVMMNNFANLEKKSPLLKSTIDAILIKSKQDDQVFNSKNKHKASYDFDDDKLSQMNNNNKTEEEEEAGEASKDRNKMNWLDWPKVRDNLDLRRRHLKTKFNYGKINDNINKQINIPIPPQAVNIESGLSKQMTTSTVPNLHEKISLNTVKENGELDQQDETKYIEPVMMYMMDDEIRMLHMITNSDETQLETPKLIKSGQDFEFLRPIGSAERARNSLLKAADIARHLSTSTSTTVKPSNTDSTKKGGADLILDQKDSNNGGQDGRVPEKDKAVSLNGNHTLNDAADDDYKNLKPKFLGYGQLQRIDGNDRLQVRLNCQFGQENSEQQSKNMSISHVEWNKFENYVNYNDTTQQPPFDCKEIENCITKPVKTDVITTVHPRPAIQNYINTTIPSYSVTLHEVGNVHLGAYRCSAVRQLEDGTKELVYRIIVLV